jgi:hypothetical protein
MNESQNMSHCGVYGLCMVSIWRAAHEKNLGSQNFLENYIEFDNVIYALELGARKVRRFGVWFP